MKDPTKMTISKRTGDAYVDDKDTLASAPETHSAEEGAENIERGQPGGDSWPSLCISQMLLANAMLDEAGWILHSHAKKNVCRPKCVD
eukprot:scaffold113017_cov23-Cyclotella_meneghiniana.AAC.2